ncbi:hypothetical protein [Streptosporangium sp. NPDC051022]|uniref:hypothetical protein n=1 Tax=Streptosporangium sp. NPDC051022 TaxID=3155752 RepID=UPI003420D2C3
MAAILILVIGVLIAAVVTVMTLLTPAPTSKSTPTFQGPEHTEPAVRQAAQLALDAYSSGSYGDFWDLWSAQAQGLIKREDYVRLLQLCPPPTQDARFTIDVVTITGDTANVHAARTGETSDFDFVFEGGSWRYTPSPAQQQEYRGRTADQLAQERRSAGTCGTATTPSTPTPAPTSAPTPVPSVPSPGQSFPGGNTGETSTPAT